MNMETVMEKQEYLRPHDVLVLLQLAIEPETTFRSLAADVGLSLGEAHNAAKRLELARLIFLHEQTVNVSATLEFLVCGVPYAFPPQLGAPSRGIATAFSASPLNREFPSNQLLVWPDHRGDSRGVALLPLSPVVAVIWEGNQELYQLLTLVDAVRVGRARERKRAREYLEHEIRSLRAR